MNVCLKALCTASFLMSACSLAETASANTYDDCILTHIGSNQNQDAIYSIQRACISTSQVTMPPLPAGVDTLKGNAWVGMYNDGTGNKKKQFVSKVLNDTGYNITKMRLVIEDKKTLIEKTFYSTDFSAPIPDGSFLSGVGTPELANIFKNETMGFVTFDISQDSEIEEKDFGKRFFFLIIPELGIATHSN